MIPSKALRLISNAAIIRHLKINQPQFISELAKELMLDEVLAGECDPIEFLLESMDNVARRQAIKNLESKLDRLKRRSDEHRKY